MKYKKSKGYSVQRIILIILCVVLAVILALMLAGTVYVETLFGRLNHVSSNETLSGSNGRVDQSTRPTDSMPEDFTGPVVNPGDITMPSGPAEAIGGDHVVNILLEGQDARIGQGIQRSDAMILCTINKDTSTLTLSSFQRDSYVTIPGYWDDKLNHSFRYGAYYNNGSVQSAFDLLNDTIEYNFGVKIDGNVLVDFESFVDVIDQVGGVDIELTEAEVNHLRGFGYQVSTGVNHMDGALALDYARIRKIDGGFARDNRQRIVIMALLEKAKTLSVTELNNLVMALLPMVTTDLSDSTIVGYMVEYLPMLTNLKVVTQEIPAEGTYYLGFVNQMSVVIITDYDANRQLLQAAMGKD